MSLVNDMLRDLDRRRRLPSDTASSRFSWDDVDEHAIQGYWKVIALTMVCIVIGVSAGYVFFKQQIVESQVAITPIFQPPVPAVPQTQAEQNLAARQSVEEMAAPVHRITVSAVDSGANEFQVRIQSAQPFPYEVVARNDFGIDVLLRDIDGIDGNSVTRGGFNLVQSAQGVNAVIELNERADFEVFRANNAGEAEGMTLVINVVIVGSSQEMTAVENTLERSQVAVAETTDNQKVQTAPPAPVAAVENVQPKAPDANANIRTSRALSFEEQDINNSQAASQLIQRGQLMAAYQKLLEFIEDHPEAHHSREAFATLLFAQQEYLQANAVIDQGLALAPNYAAYKKIKARLYLMNGQTLEAAQLLRNVPPAVVDDPEYFELLASAYQQDGQFLKAIETYQDLLRHDSKVARWWAGMGISHEALGNVGDAIASYQEAMQSPGLEPALRQYSQNRIRYLKN